MGMVFLLYLAVQKLGRRKFETAVKLTDINMELFSLEAAWHIGKQMSNQPSNLAINITILIWRQKYEKWLRCSFCSSWCICKAIQRVSEDWLLHDPRLLALRASFFFKNLTTLIRSCLCKQLRWHWRLTGCCRHGGPGTDKHCYSFLQPFSLYWTLSFF